MKTFLPSFLTLVVWFLPIEFLHGQGTTEVIAEPGLMLPGQSEALSEVEWFPGVNESGNVLFHFLTPSSDPDDLRLAEWDQGQYTVVLDEGELGIIGSLGSFVMGYANDHILVFQQDNSSGLTQRVFAWQRDQDQWIEYFSPGSPDPDGNGEIRNPWLPHTSRNGHWTLFEQLENTANGTLDNGALSVVNGTGAPMRIARENDPAPGGGTFRRFSPTSFSGNGGLLPDDYSINSSGQVSFGAPLTPETLEMGIFLWDGTANQLIVKDGQISANGDEFKLPAKGSGTVHSFRNGLNDLGQIGIQTRMLDGVSGEEFDAAFLWDGQQLVEKLRMPFPLGSFEATRIVSSVQLNTAGHMALAVSDPNTRSGIVVLRDGQMRTLFYVGEPADDDLEFVFLPANQDNSYNEWEPSIFLNEHGAVCFFVFLQDQGGSGDTVLAYFVSDGIDRLPVVMSGQNIGAGQIEILNWPNEFAFQGNRYFNDFGQVVYEAGILETGQPAIQLWTPDLNWRTTQSGDWEDKNNWTLGLPPALVHKVFVDATTDVTVTGPSEPTEVKQLSVGGDPAVRSELRLQSTTLSTTNGLLVLEGGVLSGSGSVGGDVDVFGEVSPGVSPGVITTTGDLMLNSGAVTSIEIEGTQPNRYDRLIVKGDVQLGGVLDVIFGSRSFLVADQEFLIGDFAGTVTGQFANAPEGTVVHSDGTLQVEVSNTLGDGNDFGLVVNSVDAVQPFGRKLLDGVEVAGSLSDTDNSDDAYYELDPPPTTNPVKQIVEVILLGETSVSNPSSFSFRLEAAMSGGASGDVIQTIEFWNENVQQWEEFDSRPASNSDSTVHVTATGDLTRFIHPLTSEIIAKVKWESENFSGSPFDWCIDIDQLGWLID